MKTHSAPTVTFVVGDPLLPIVGGGHSRIIKMIDYLRGAGFRVELVTLDHGIRGNAELRRWVDRLWWLGDPETDPEPLRTKRYIKRYLAAVLPRPAIKLYRWLRGREKNDPKKIRLSSFILRKINENLCLLASWAARQSQPVAVVCIYAWTARALDRLPEGTLKIIDTIDIQHLRRQLAQAAGSDLPHHACTREEEVQELRRADVLLAIQRHEETLLREMCPDRNVILVEHAFDVDQRLYTPSSSCTVLFVGAYYDPNIVGLKRFLADSWPKVRAAVPKALLVVCGRVCEAIETPPEGVELKGRVPDLRPYYENAAVIINPSPYGSGLKIKSVEALSYGKSLVSTPAGVYGIEEDESGPYVVCPEIGDMAECIIPILTDVNRRRRIESETWRYARERFTPENVYRRLIEVLSTPTAHIVAGKDSDNREWPETEKTPAGVLAGLENGHFLHWEGNRPSAWALANPDSRINRPADRAGVEIQPLALGAAASISGIYQKIMLPPGSEFTFTARLEAVSGEPGKFGFVLAHFRAEGDPSPKIFTKNHPGDGKIHPLQIKGQLRQGMTPGFLKLSIIVRQGASQAPCVRAVMFDYSPLSAPVTAVPSLHPTVPLSSPKAG